MTILFLLRLWPSYGGGETVTINLANEMVKRGLNVHVLYFKDSVKSTRPFIDDRIRVSKINGIDCDEFHAAKSDANRVSSYIQHYVFENDVNWVINQWLPAEYTHGLKGGNAKVVKCLHQALYTPLLNDSGIKSVLKKVFKPFYLYRKKRKAINEVNQFLPYVDKYVFLSPLFQRQYEAMYPPMRKSEMLLSISNPIAVESHTSSLDMSQKENIVLLVGRMVEGQKRVSYAIKIWSLIECRPELAAWKFVVVGEGPDLNQYKKLAESLNLKRIIFEGFQNPTSYYEKAKVFLMTSAFEGFGMTLVESALHGVVSVVMNSYLSLHDIIKDNENGFIVPNNDFKMFEERLSRLMIDDALREKMARNAYESCSKFRVEAIVDSWEKLFWGE